MTTMKTLPEIRTALDIMQNLGEVEQFMLAQEQVSCPVRHHFSHGIYIRELSVPAGTFAVGHHQKQEQLNIFLQGKVAVINESGTVDILKAPMMFIGKTGRKVGYVMEDMVWLNVFPTEEKDIETLEEMLFDKSENSVASQDQMKKVDRSDDRDDFQQMLQDLNISAEMVRSQSEFEGDQIPFMDQTVTVKVADSAIEGRGLFATVDFSEGEIIAPMRLGDFRTPAGRFTNHAKEPNAIVDFSGDAFFLKAKRAIKGCHGGFDGEEITIDYRQSVETVRRHQRCQE